MHVLVINFNIGMGYLKPKMAGFGVAQKRRMVHFICRWFYHTLPPSLTQVSSFHLHQRKINTFGMRLMGIPNIVSQLDLVISFSIYVSPLMSPMADNGWWI